MKATGRHLLVEYKNCDKDILNDGAMIETLMRQAAVAADTTVVTSVFHPFFPQGISGVVVIEESHLSIHTWPEYGYAAVDFFTCGDGIPERAHEVLQRGLKAEVSEVMFVNRGMIENETSMSISYHRSEIGGGPVVPMSTLRDVAETEPLTPSAAAVNRA